MSEPNPYQSPVSLDQPAEPDGFYTSRLTALRYVEIWRIAESWNAFAFGVIAKTLRLPRPSNTVFKVLEPFKVLDEGELPENAREKLVPIVDSWHELGLELAFYDTTERRGPDEAYAANFLNQSGTIAATTTWVRVRVRQLVKERLSCFVLSWLTDGTVLSTSNQRRLLDAPEMFQRIHLPGASIDDLLRIHVERLETVPRNRLLSLDRDRLLERRNADKRCIAEFHIRRGFWAPKPAEAVAANAIT